jgi:hypothetical protein
VEKRLTFAYGHTLVLYRLALFALLFGAVGVFLAFLSSVPFLPTVLFLLFLAAVAVVFAASPALTKHWLTRSRLILRQGWYFRTILPLADVTSVNRAEDNVSAPLGIHRPLGRPVLFVTGGRVGLVAVHLAAPRRFWSAFGLSATEIVFDVDRPDELLAALDERRGLLAPVQADRSNADLRD